MPLPEGLQVCLQTGGALLRVGDKALTAQRLRTLRGDNNDDHVARIRHLVTWPPVFVLVDVSTTSEFSTASFIADVSSEMLVQPTQCPITFTVTCGPLAPLEPPEPLPAGALDPLAAPAPAGAPDAACDGAIALPA